MLNILFALLFLASLTQPRLASAHPAAPSRATTQAEASAPSAEDEKNDRKKFLIEREFWFEINPQEAGITPSQEFPDVFSVIMDWRVHDRQVLVGVVSDGTSSLYISPGPRILGGYSAKEQAQSAITAAERIYRSATQVSTHPLPPFDEVSFYIRTYNGLLMLREKQSDLLNGRGKALQLFEALNAVMSIHLDAIETDRSPKTRLHHEPFTLL